MSKEKKEGNVDSSLAILNREDIEYVRHTRYHYVVKGNLGNIDYWPSTGKYITRYGTTTGRGVFNLIKEVRKDG